MINLKLKRFSFLVIFFLPALFLSPAYALESADQIIRELDAHYYYPQQSGLEKLSVQIDWEQLDVVSGSGRYLKNPAVVFFWNRGSSEGAQGVFTLADKSVEVSLERKREILGMLQNYQEVVIPQTLVEKLADYKGQIKIAKKHRRLIEFSSLNPGAAIQKYDLMVDLKQKNVSNFQMERNAAPIKIKSDVRYTRKEGKWLTAESRSKFRMGEMNYNETTEFVYRRINNFWLIGKMTQTIKADDRIIQSFIFRFRNYKIN
jgi:hypothetical protein